MSLKRPVTIAQARRWPAAAARRESFCARMGGMREQLTSGRTARDPRSRINRALAAWDCDRPELLEARHVSKGIRPMKITSKMVGAEARANPAPGAIKWEMYDPQSKTQRAMVGGVEVLVTPVRSAAEARSYEMPEWTRAILEVAPDKLHANTQLPHGSMREAKDPINVAGAIQFARKDYKPKSNPARKTAGPKRNPGAKIMYRFALVPNDGGFEYGMDDRTPVRFVFSARDRKKGIYRSFQLPASAVQNAAFQAWVNSLPGADVVMTLGQLRQVIRSYMT